MNRHRNGQFAPRPVRVAVPMLLAVNKCERVSKGNRTKAAQRKALVMAVAAQLDAEVRAARWARGTIGILERFAAGVGE